MKKHSFSTIDEYIALQPPSVRPLLRQLRTAIRKAAPKAEEIISYGMPAYKYCGRLAYFSAWEKHIGFYPGGKAVIEQFLPKLKAYQTSPGTIQFSLEKPIPVKLVSDMIKYRVKQNEELEVARKAKRNTGKMKSVRSK